MGERIGRAWQGVALFTVGVLVGALVLGGGSFALPVIGDDAKAQGAATWQSKAWHGEIGPGEVEINYGQSAPDPEAFLNDWVETLPAECDLGPIFQTRFDTAVMYRCPQ